MLPAFRLLLEIVKHLMIFKHHSAFEQGRAAPNFTPSLNLHEGRLVVGPHG
jgi:hypothetical protein